MKTTSNSKKLGMKAALAQGASAALALTGALPATASGSAMSAEPMRGQQISQDIGTFQNNYIPLPDRDCRSIPGHSVYISSTARNLIRHTHRGTSGTTVPYTFNDFNMTQRRTNAGMLQEVGPTFGYMSASDYTSATTVCDV